jgi:hypothetical protein
LAVLWLFDAGTVGDYEEAEAMFRRSLAAQTRMEDGQVLLRLLVI